MSKTMVLGAMIAANDMVVGLVGKGPVTDPVSALGDARQQWIFAVVQ
jgi:hypothetical protein